MTHTFAKFAAIAAAFAVQPFAAHAQSVTAPNEAVARTFIAAAQAQDHKAALQLLDDKVSIRFAGAASRSGYGEGQPFVIGYLDGLFDGQHAVSLDGAAAYTGHDGAVRFTAHDARFHDHYAIDVEVKDQHVVRVTVNLEPQAGSATTVAALDPS